MLQYRITHDYVNHDARFPPTSLRTGDVVAQVREEDGFLVGALDGRVVAFPPAVAEPVAWPTSPGVESVGIAKPDYSINVDDPKRRSVLSEHSQNSYHVLMDDFNEQPTCFGFQKSRQKFHSRFSVKQRYCILCLLVSAVVAIVMLPLFYTVIGPDIAQAAVNQANVDFKSVMISQPGTDTFQLSASGVVKDAGVFEGKMKPMDIDVYFDGKVMGKARLPSIKAGPDAKAFKIDEKFQITDVALFDSFVRTTIYQPEVTWTLVGDATLSASIMGLPFTFENINFDKTSTLTAFNSFPNVELLVFDLTQSNATHINVDMQVNLFNPAVLNIDPLGDMEFDILYKGARMGTLNAKDVKVFVGENILSMFGSIVPDNMEIADELFSRYLRGDDTVVSAVATENASSIELYREALVGLELSTILKGQETELVESMDFASMFLRPIDNSTVSLLSATIITIVNPLGDNSPLVVKFVRLGAELSYNGLAFGNVTTDFISVEGGDQLTFEITLDVNMTLLDEGRPFSTFMEDFVKLPFVNITISGYADVIADCAIGELKLSGLPVNVVSGLDGLNGIPGIEIIQLDLPSNAPEGGVEALLTAVIPNPTIAGISLGDAVFDVVYKGVHFGYAFAKDLTMESGNNVVNMRGYILPDEEDLDLLSEFVSLYLGGVNTTVGVTGLDTTLNGAHLGWLSSLVQTLELNSNLQGMDIDLISSITIKSMDVNFPSGANPLSAASVVAGFNCPFDFPLFVYTVMMQVNLVDSQQRIIGFLDIPPQPSSSDQYAGIINVAFSDIPIQVNDSNAFSQLVSDILLTPGTSICMKGISDSQVSSSMGNFEIMDINIDICGVALQGMNNLNGQISISTLRVMSGPDVNTLNILIDLNINNPATLSASLGDVTFLLYYMNVQIGYSFLPNLSLALGPNPFVASATFIMPSDPNSQTIAKDFLTKFLEGTKTTAELRGYEQSSNNPYLIPAMTNFKTSTQVPGSATPLINRVDIKVNLFDALFRGFILGDFHLENPMDADAFLSKIDFVVSYEGTRIGSIVEVLNPPIKIPSKQIIKTGQKRVNVDGISQATLEVLIGATRGIALNAVGKINVQIDQFSTENLNYSQYPVMTYSI